MRAAYHTVDDRSERGFQHTRGTVGQTHDNLTTVIFPHGTQDTTSDIGAHTVQGGHGNICRGSNHLGTFQHLLTQPIVTHHLLAIVLRVVRDTQTHQRIVDIGIADKDGQLGHHIHVVVLTIGDKALSVIRTAVLFERGVAQCQTLGTRIGGKAADNTTKEDKHDRTVQHLIVHQVDGRMGSNHYDGQGSCSMGVRQTEHQPHGIPVLTTPPCHGSGGQQLGECSCHHHNQYDPQRVGVAQHDAHINEHSHTYQEVWDENGITHKLESRHQRTGLGDKAVHYQACQEST